MNGAQKSVKRIRFVEDDAADPPPDRKRPPSRLPESKGLRKIIKGKCPNGQFVRMQVRKTELERNKYLIKMRKGAIFYKFNQRTGLPEERWFIVSPDGSSIKWTKPTTNFLGIKTTKTKNLADALYLTYGNSESVKPQQKIEIPTWLCFTIVFCEKTGTTSKSWVTREVSVACKDQEQFETWFFGIQSLIPLHHQHKSQAYILWERAMMKVESIAFVQQTTPSKVWQTLFENAIRHVKGSSQRFMLRKLVHMNLSRLARQAREEETDTKDSSPPPIKAATTHPNGSSMPSDGTLSPGQPTQEKKLTGRRSLRDLYQESPRHSPVPGHRRIGTHDLTERMINRKSPYVEKKVGSSVSRQASERSIHHIKD
uniref:PH domain-containing protein n=1 Tax=Lotharella oceanica TaxID=641309 RepID=A0A7S2TZ95_9EUKA|mmetsp:Transcript_34962/g.64741  ORF Transcript_34962/g.64741 Transcript_34962/m.64741 type:complete len:369 (+) Transcript_34962:142-1248(+)